MSGPEEGAQGRRVGRPFSSETEELKWLLEHATTLYEMYREMYHAEGDRSDRYRSAWLSARSRAKWVRRNADSNLRFAHHMWGDALHDISRYRSAWLSARQRAALESVYATEALALRDAELASLRAELEDMRKSTCATETGRHN